MLEKAIDEYNKNVADKIKLKKLKPKLDSETRWYSTY